MSNELSQGQTPTLGQILKEVRESKKLSPKSVLDETGVSNEYLRKLEADEVIRVSAGVLWKLSEYYDIDFKPLAIKAFAPVLR
jgi:transcriptional regulator with XRE-family HTH domain